jgi:hypothetical protein
VRVWLGTCPRDLAAKQSVLSALLLSKDDITDVLERLRAMSPTKGVNNRPSLWPF